MIFSKKNPPYSSNLPNCYVNFEDFKILVEWKCHDFHIKIINKSMYVFQVNKAICKSTDLHFENSLKLRIVLSKQ
jgi:hypothetical protein